MPLFKVQVRTKGDGAEGSSKDDPASHEVDPVAQDAAPEQRATEASRAEPRRGSGLTAIVAGVLFGLVLIAGVSFYLVRAGGADAGRAAVGGAPADAPPGLVPAATVVPAQLDMDMGPSSINPEFRLEDVIAQVNGEPITMRDLDRSVRVARVLGELTGDVVPANGQPEMRDFQIQMLKRLVDLELMRQAAEREGMLIPGGETTTIVEGFLSEAGATQAELDQAMALHNVTLDELDRWFHSARTANFYVTQKLMVGNETASRDEITATWLQTQWETQQIAVNFYDPEG